MSGSPIIVRGGAAAARLKWTRGRLVTRFGDRICRLSLDSRPALAPETASSTLADYFAYLDGAAVGGEPRYLFHTEADAGGAADWLADLELPALGIEEHALKLWRLFSGPAGSGTLPHVHGIAVNALLEGAKQWAVFVGPNAAETRRLLDDGYAQYGSGRQAHDWFEHEWPLIKRRAGVEAWEFTQEAGDAVIVPALMIHAVLNLTAATGFTIEWNARA